MYEAAGYEVAGYEVARYEEVRMPLAEGPAIEGELLAIILAVLIGMGLAWLLVVVLGFKWAISAARGSRNARGLWAGAAVVACVPGLLAGPNPLLLVGLLVVGAQAATYLSVRGR